MVLNAGRPPFDDPSVRAGHGQGHRSGSGRSRPSVTACSKSPTAPSPRARPGTAPTRTSSTFDLGEARASGGRLPGSYRAAPWRSGSRPSPTRPGCARPSCSRRCGTRAGAEVQIVTLDQAGFIKPLINGEFEAAVISNFGTVDPDFNYLFWHSSLVAPPGQLSINFSHTVDPAIDAALEGARRTDDVATRARLLPDDHPTVERRRGLRLALPNPDLTRRDRPGARA